MTPQVLAGHQMVPALMEQLQHTQAQLLKAEAKLHVIPVTSIKSRRTVAMVEECLG